MNGFSVLFVAALAAGLAFEWWLDRRQINHVGSHRDAVPDAFAAQVSATAHRRAADYTRARVRASATERGYEALVVLAWTLGGGIAVLDRGFAATGLPPLAAGTALVLTVLLIQGALELPFSVYRTFGIEQRFGYNRTTPGLFAADLLKQALIALVLGTPLVAAVLWLLERAGALWWLWSWAVWLGFTVLLAWAWPNLIAPLFNRFERLADGELAARLEALLARHGVGTRGVWVMDGSRRSGHGNAYFAGIGTARRVVLFDTLVEQLSAEQVEAVVAHELGHYRHRHVLLQMATSAVVALAALALAGAMLREPWFALGVGLAPASSAAAKLVAFLFVAPRFAPLLRPLVRRIARAHEYQADGFAARECGAEALAGALVALYRDNAATLTPDALYSAYHDTHPPAPLRVGRLLASAG